MLEKYFCGTAKAIKVLQDENLYGHMLIIIYSTIDACGLLDASSNQVEATSTSFKNWVKKYLLPNTSLGFNEVDLWGARCSVLHTFTSESRLSRKGEASELQYYTGDPSSQQTKDIVSSIKSLNDGEHIPVHLGDLTDAFLKVLPKFAEDLYEKCEENLESVDRLRKVLQMYFIPDDS